MPLASPREERNELARVSRSSQGTPEEVETARRRMKAAKIAAVIRENRRFLDDSLRDELHAELDSEQ